MSLLVVEQLAKSFGGVVAARSVSFDLEAGRLLAIIGPNGAGKSTIFNMVGGQLAPDGGRVVLDGQDITAQPPRRIWRLGVGRTFQVAQTFVSMTVVENVQMALISRNGRTRDSGSRQRRCIAMRHWRCSIGSAWRPMPSARAANLRTATSSAWSSPSRSRVYRNCC